MPPHETPRDFDVTQVTDVRALRALVPEWRALWARVENTTPFQSPDWLVPWWDHLGRGELLVLTLRRDGALVGVAPLCIGTDVERGTRTMFLLGTGVSDYGDILLDDDVGAVGLAPLLEAIADCGGRWDATELQQLRVGSALLAAPMPGAVHDARTSGEPCPALELPRTVDDLQHVLPARTVHELAYLRRRIAREGRVDLDVATPATVDSLLDVLFVLHDARWAARGMPGVLDDRAVQEFHRHAARALFEAGALRLLALRFEGQVIAALYGFMHGRRACYYIGGWDPAYARFGAGHLIVGRAIEDAVREGARVFDFLRGREAYKYRWGATDRPTWQRRVTHAAARAGAAR